MKRVLIVGASSLVGLNLAKYLRDKYRVFGTSFQHPVRVDNVVNFRLRLDSIAEAQAFVKWLRPDAVIYCPALTESQSEGNPEAARHLHEEIPGAMARQLPESARFIYLSTSKVFSGAVGNYTETDASDPSSVYGLSKKLGEELLLHNPNVFILRLGSVFGLGHVQSRSVLNRVLRQLWSHAPLSLVFDEYRSFLFTDELSRAVGVILDADPDGSALYHVSTGVADSHFSFARAVAQTFGLSFDRCHAISGVEFDAQQSTSTAAHRGKNLTLDGRLFSEVYSFRYEALESSLHKLREGLRSGQQ